MHIRSYQQRHLDLREEHLESLAQARISSVCPSFQANPDKFKCATAKEVRRIQRNERCSRSHRAIRRCLRPSTIGSGLAKVDVPHDRAADPKLWEGPWDTITEPNLMAEYVCCANAQQYHQAHETPFASEPLLSYIGINGDGPGAEDILQGITPPQHIVDKLLPETKAILETLANLPTPLTPPDTKITPEKFQQLYKILPDKISSSPSGRHIGHYKAISQSDDLSALWAIMMYIPHLVGFSPSRWQTVVDVMLEKSPGNSKLHRLRSIALQESDFNQSNWLAFGRPVMHLLEDSKLLPPMQHGSRPARLCISAVLNKQLQLEIQCYRKLPFAYIENDATGCYDRIVNPLVLLFLWKLGVPAATVKSLASTWESTIHRIKTLYGVLD